MLVDATVHSLRMINVRSNNKEFLGAMANAIHVGTYHKVALRFPFIWMLKHEIVLYAAEMGVPLELTWSCYSPVAIGDEDDPEFIHCGKCPTCKERAFAFAQVGFADPTAYAIDLQDILGNEYHIENLEDWLGNE